MDEQWFVYSFVARGRVIVADHRTNNAGNLPEVAAQWLVKLPIGDNKLTFNSDHHSFNFLLENREVYGVVAKESVRNQISFEFLERVREDFKKQYGRGKGNPSIDKDLSKEFGPVMKQHMQDVADHAEEIDKLAKVNAQISEIEVIILDNIEKVVKRGEHINSVSDKAEELNNEAQGYKKTAVAIKRKMWYQNVKVKLVILGIILVIIALIVWVSICSGFNCSN